MSGKAYAHKTGNRPGDLYHTPKSLVWVADYIIRCQFDINEGILEPCAGELSLAEELAKIFKSPGVTVNDLFYDQWENANLPGTSFDYLKADFSKYKQVITNPPFSLWDEFVRKAKSHCKKFMFIGRLNYLGTQSRIRSGLWENLKAIYPFSRYVDYQTPLRSDGLFHVGCQTTGWFLWDMDYYGDARIRVLDVQDYAQLGNLKRSGKGFKN